MLKWTTLGVVVTCTPLLMSLPAQAENADDPALSELVEILRSQGVLNNEQYQAVSAKAAAHDTANEEDWTDKISAWGDFRSRYESVHYDSNSANRQRDANGDRATVDATPSSVRKRLRVRTGTVPI